MTTLPLPTDDGDTPLIDPKVIADLRSLASEGEDADAFLVDLVGTYVNLAPPLLAEIAAAVKSGDGKALTQVAHRLKGCSVNLGLRRLAAVCEELEALGQGDRAPAAEALLAPLLGQYEAAIQALTSRWGRAA